MADVDPHVPESITRFHQRLNRQDTVPGVFYRRNHSAYSLICYVNNIGGCLICGNYSASALFLARASEELSFLRSATANRSTEELAYLALVEQYLKAVASHVLSREAMPEVIERIPKELWPPNNDCRKA